LTLRIFGDCGIPNSRAAILGRTFNQKHQDLDLEAVLLLSHFSPQAKTLERIDS